MFKNLLKGEKGSRGEVGVAGFDGIPGREGEHFKKLTSFFLKV